MINDFLREKHTWHGVCIIIGVGSNGIEQPDEAAGVAGIGQPPLIRGIVEYGRRP
jgi:hypothetical protein